jgi:hypothetical protein
MFKGIAKINHICLLQKTKVGKKVGQPFTIASTSFAIFNK